MTVQPRFVILAHNANYHHLHQVGTLTPAAAMGEYSSGHHARPPQKG